MSRSAVLAALKRASTLLGILDREHEDESLYATLRGVRHEVETAKRLLAADTTGTITAGRDRARYTRRGSARHALLGHIAKAGPDGVTDVDAAVSLGLDVRVLRSRRSELRAAGYVQPRVDPVGRPVKAQPAGPPGSRQGLWTVTDAGQRLLDKLNTVQAELPLDTPFVGG